MLLSAFLLIDMPTHADILRKHNGEILDGKFLGGTEYVVYFHTREGRLDVPVEDILSISFLPSSAKLPQREPLPTPTPTPSPEELTVTVPSDTRVSVRMLMPLDSLASRQGDPFDALLERDILVGGQIVFPKGTPVSGVVVRSDQGKSGSALVIELREFYLEDRRVPVKTSSYAMWDLPGNEDDSSLRVIRTLSIAADAIVGFKTITPITLELGTP
jgi:hypothetical protein